MEKDGYVLTEIRKGMYGLPQAGRLSNNPLTKIFHRMDNTNYTTHQACVITSGEQSPFP